METTKKQNVRKFSDLFHVAIYITILLLFANYESGRKSDLRQQASGFADEDYSLHSETSARTNVTFQE